MPQYRLAGAPSWRSDSAAQIEARTAMPIPEPVYTSPPPTTPGVPPLMDHHERMRFRTAAYRANSVYPGPVGQILARELLAFEDFGVRLGRDGPVMQLVEHLMADR